MNIVLPSNTRTQLRFDLQLFADGAGAGDGVTGAEGNTGVTEGVAVPHVRKGVKNPLANVKYGIQPTESPAAEANADASKKDNAAKDSKATEQEAPKKSQADRQEEFEALIKGEFKDLYDARMQDTVRQRLKGHKEMVDNYNALSPAIELLSKKYGLEASDITGLVKAIEADDTLLEQEALERDMTVDQLRRVKTMERENAELKRLKAERERQDNASRLYAKWVQEADATKTVYPSFDLESEMKSPEFVKLIRSNVDVRTAYEVLHRDEIIPAAMQYAAQTAEQKVTQRVMASGARPVENGNSSQGAAEFKSDVTKLTRADRAEINRRVARGERVVF